MPTPRSSRRFPVAALAAGFTLAAAIVGWAGPVLAETAAEREREREHESAALPLPAAGTRLPATRVRATEVAVVNVREIAKRDAMAKPFAIGAFTPIAILQGEETSEAEIDEPITGTPVENYTFPQAGTPAFVASPTPSLSFIGLDDIPRVGTSSITIPPDVDGAVGPNHIMETLNNNYRFFNKATGAVTNTISITSFWNPIGGSGHFDPKTYYDPVNNRWIAVAVSNGASTASSILLGVSQTDDPTGSWNLFRVLGDSTGVNWADFPCVGFNRNWIAINVNMFTVAANAGAGAKMLVLDYPQARGGTFVANMITGTGFCTAPAVTYSNFENTLYAPTHLSSAGGTYRLDTITGTPTAPVYTVGATRARGLTWTQPSGALLPQAAPLSGVSSCGATPCKLETQDSQIRTSPVFRNGAIYYSQTVGVPAGGLTHTAVQWTKLDAASGNVSDGGRIEDPTATATNGGKWYAYSHLAVNSTGDVALSLGQFSSTQFGSAAYAFRGSADAAGTFRDPVVIKAGEDYYRKDFGSGRNRWGDYVKAQVDPSDDQALWVLSEYAKTRTGTDDGTTGSNSSKWGTWWARISAAVNIDVGPSVNELNVGTSTANVAVNLSQVVGVPVVVNYAVSDGTATTADNDYASSLNQVTIPAGALQANIPITINGDTKRENNETLTVTLTSSTGAPLGSTTVATVTIVNDDPIPSITVNDVTLPEGNSGSSNATFTLTLSNASATPIAVDYATADGTATAGSDYTTTTGTATFAAGVTTAQVVVPIAGDTVNEPNETFFVNLTNSLNASIADAQGLGTITNDDAAPTLAIQPSASIVEGNVGTSAVNLQVSLSALSSSPVTVAFTTSNGTAIAGSDFVATSGTLTFPANTTTPQTISVQVNGDVVLEADETFNVTLSSPSGATISAGTATVTIVNDEGVPVLSIGDAATAEGQAGNTRLVFTVSLSGPSDSPVTAQFSTSDGTASAALSDYVARTGTITLPAFVTSDTIGVTVKGDITCEANEAFALTLFNVSGAAAGDTVAAGAITNDDDCTPPTVTVTAPNGGEAWAPATSQVITWTATDNVGVTRIDIDLSRDNGVTYEQLSAGEVNDGTFTWTVTAPTTTFARVRVVASDAGGNSANDVSDGSFAIVNPTGGVGDGPVTAFALNAVTPNPTVRTASIGYALPRESRVRLSVVDLQGRTVATLVDGVMPAGRHTARWDTGAPGGPRAAGIFFARLEAGKFVATKRFAVTR